MKTYHGNTYAPIWLIGDSAPSHWIDVLEHPFDQRHPAVHNIWTPIIYRIQRYIYKKKSVIIDDEENRFFIKNAVSQDNKKPARDIEIWDKYIDLNSELIDMKNSIEKYNPKMVITFGTFAFEFIRRCYILKKDLWYKYGHWGAKNLGEIFIKNIKDKEIIIPLLHISISNGNWLSSHKQFKNNENGNYFDFVALNLYERIIDVLNL
ncbi:MAG: hypothetical protein LBD07_02505 [Spirochaetaceae bacterium]|jgi:hypothetical protein|nr:hypothetical protein [Spirochaetaceae bacterium]